MTGADDQATIDAMDNVITMTEISTKSKETADEGGWISYNKFVLEMVLEKKKKRFGPVLYLELAGSVCAYNVS